MFDKVEKALSQEEITILGNIKASIEELMQMNTQSVPGAQPAKAELAEGPVVAPTEPTEEDKKKVVAAKSDEGTHADDKAEDIIADQPEWNEKNINDVAKAIALALRNKDVKKYENFDKVIKELKEENQALKKSVENILEGFGIANQVKKSTEISKSEPDVRKSQNDPEEIKKSVEEIKRMLNPSGDRPKNAGWGWDSLNPQSGVAKSIAAGIEKVIS